MSFFIKTVLLSVFIPFLLLMNGCSKDSNDGVGYIPVIETPIDPEVPVDPEDPEVPTVTERVSSFSIALASVRGAGTDVEVFEYDISVKRGDTELMDSMADYISAEKNPDGSVSLNLKTVIEGSVTSGIDSLALGDIVTFEAKGYTPQQFVVTQNMLDTEGTTVALKAIESRQTYSLADMVSGSDSVTPRTTFGARTTTTEDSVVFETVNKQTSLTMPKDTYSRMVRKIARLPRSGTTTQVHLDMTSIDPKTEHLATIGNFSYDPESEPVSEREVRATEDSSDTALESVIMADLKMTTDAGDEIHCFGDGIFDPITNKCSDSATATLKMKIPESQFQQYSGKYNNGDRVVPLYSYSTSKATWVRQLDDNGLAMDGVLVLEDNNNDSLANDGDVLYIEGQVGHFSWWNGDYATSRTCVNVNLDLSNNIGLSHILVKGVDYSGRQFKQYINDTNISRIENISAKADAIISVELIMVDGTVADSTTHTTGTRSSDGTCEDVEKTLVATLMNENVLDVLVTDLEDTPLPSAYIYFKNRSYLTDAEGKVNINTAYADDYNATLSVTYYANDFSVRDSKEVDQTTTTATFKLDVAVTSFTGHVVEIVNGVESVADNAYISIYGNGYYKYARSDENGTFTVELPTTKVNEDPDVRVYVRTYNSDYSYYPSISENVTIDVTNKDIGTFTLDFITHKITGRVTDTLNNGLSGVYVYTWGISRSTTTDEDGYYEMLLLGSTETDVSVHGYYYADKYLYATPKNLITEENGESEINLEIELRKATIKGTILTSTGVALENMRVYWSQDYYNYVETDANGDFSLETYNGGDGVLRVYDISNWKYLDFDANLDIRDISISEVKIGEVLDIGNKQVVARNFAPIISSVTINPTDPLADVQFSLNIDAYDPDGDPISYSVTQRYGDTLSIEDSNSTTLITAPTSGYYYLLVTVKDSNDNETNKYMSVYVKNHVRPVVESMNIDYPNGLSYFDKTNDLNITVSAYSDEGNALVYSYVFRNLSTGDEFTASSTQSSMALESGDLDNGRYKLTMSVSDIYNTSRSTRYITIDDTVAPVIDTLLLNNISINNYDTLYIKSGDTLTLDVNLTASSAGQSGLSWYWYVKYNSTNEQTIDDVDFDSRGNYYGYVSVRDERGRSDYRSFYISVATNQTPIINSIMRTPTHITKNSDSNFTDADGNSVSNMTFLVDASDSDDTNLSFTFSNLDLGNTNSDVDTNSSDNKAIYNLSGLSTGRHSLKVTVSDGTNSVEKYKTFEILENLPPKIVSMIVPTNVKVSHTISLNASAIDQNSETEPSYKWTIEDDDGSTMGTISNSSSATATFNAPNSAKDIILKLLVSDGANDVVRMVTVHVLENKNPIISYLDGTPLSMILGQTTINLRARYGDVDGTISSAIYSILDINGSEVSTFSAGANDVLLVEELAISTEGTYTLVLKVVDNDNAEVTEDLTLIVVKPNANPIITAFTASKTSVLSNEEVTFNVSASDPDGDAITIDWSVNPSATLTTDRDSATFSSTVLGEYIVTVIVSDTDGAKASQTLSIAVVDMSLTLASTATNVEVGSSVTFTASLSRTGYSIPSDTVWTLSTKPSSSTVSITGNGATAEFAPDVAGTYTVSTTVTLNGVAYEATKSITVTDTTTVSPDVEGVVTSSTGDELSGVSVRLYNSTDSALYDETTTTDSSGKYTFDTVPAGTYYLVIYAGDDFITQTKTIIIQ